MAWHDCYVSVLGGGSHPWSIRIPELASWWYENAPVRRPPPTGGGSADHAVVLLDVLVDAAVATAFYGLDALRPSHVRAMHGPLAPISSCSATPICLRQHPGHSRCRRACQALPDASTSRPPLRFRLLKIGGWMRYQAEGLRLHLASSHLAAPLGRLVATRFPAS